MHNYTLHIYTGMKPYESDAYSPQSVQQGEADLVGDNLNPTSEGQLHVGCIEVRYAEMFNTVMFLYSTAWQSSHIYIYREKDRQRKREIPTYIYIYVHIALSLSLHLCISLSLSIYIYKYVNVYTTDISTKRYR